MLYFMQKVIEMENSNNKHLEVKCTNDYSFWGKKKESNWRKQHVFPLKSFTYGQIEIYIYHFLKTVINYVILFLLTAASQCG